MGWSWLPPQGLWQWSEQFQGCVTEGPSYQPKFSSAHVEKANSSVHQKCSSPIRTAITQNCLVSLANKLCLVIWKCHKSQTQGQCLWRWLQLAENSVWLKRGGHDQPSVGRMPISGAEFIWGRWCFALLVTFTCSKQGFTLSSKSRWFSVWWTVLLATSFHLDFVFPKSARFSILILESHLACKMPCCIRKICFRHA